MWPWVRIDRDRLEPVLGDGLLDTLGGLVARVDDHALLTGGGGDQITVGPPGPGGEPGNEHDRPSIVRQQDAAVAPSRHFAVPAALSLPARPSGGRTRNGTVYGTWPTAAASPGAARPLESPYVRRLEGDETVVSSEQRRKQLAREKFERQRKRREAARRKARIRNAAIALGVVLVLGAGGAYAASGGLNGDKKGDGKKDDAADESPSKASDPCDKAAKGLPNGKRWEKEPTMKVDKSASYSMDLDTTCGRIGISMDAGKAPHTVNSFSFLAGQKFFDHTPCHRLAEDTKIHILQCGDPQGTGQGGPGYTIPDENLKDPRIKGKKYPAGTVAMANQYDAKSGKGRDSGGSQFFLVFADSELPPDYTPFGTITEGMDVLKKIAKAGSTPDPRTRNTPPNATVMIDKATVRKS